MNISEHMSDLKCPILYQLAVPMIRKSWREITSKQCCSEGSHPLIDATENCPALGCQEHDPLSLNKPSSAMILCNLFSWS